MDRLQPSNNQVSQEPALLPESGNLMNCSFPGLNLIETSYCRTEKLWEIGFLLRIFQITISLNDKGQF